MTKRGTWTEYVLKPRYRWNYSVRAWICNRSPVDSGLAMGLGLWPVLR